MSKPNNGAGYGTSGDKVLDVFGAHVGLTLEDLHRLRYVRCCLEEATGRAWSLYDALAFTVRATSDAFAAEMRRRPDADQCGADPGG